MDKNSEDIRNDALNRVEASTKLSPFKKAFISNGSGESHWKFIAEASEDELLQWLRCMYDEPGTVF